MASLYLISGLPGIGKTSVVSQLCNRYPDTYERLHFGALLREVVEQHSSATMAHAEFRARFRELVTREVIESATLSTRRQVDNSPAPVCLLDSHAVSPTIAGIRCTPDSPERLRLLGLAGIVHLALAGALERVLANGEIDGRVMMSEAEAEVAEQAQLATIVIYAAMSDCPAVIVDSSGPVEGVAERVDGAIRASRDWGIVRGE
jgi:adenylate kinase